MTSYLYESPACCAAGVGLTACSCACSAGPANQQQPISLATHAHMGSDCCSCKALCTVAAPPLPGTAAAWLRRREAGASDAARGRPGSTLLNSSDPFYKEFRDLPYYITSQRCGKLLLRKVTQFEQNVTGCMLVIIALFYKGIRTACVPLLRSRLFLIAALYTATAYATAMRHSLLVVVCLAALVYLQAAAVRTRCPQGVC
jgi:hypothetical protein